MAMTNAAQLAQLQAARGAGPAGAAGRWGNKHDAELAQLAGQGGFSEGDGGAAAMGAPVTYRQPDTVSLSTFGQGDGHLGVKSAFEFEGPSQEGEDYGTA